MKIFLDSADINEVKEAISWGVVDGITTNPSLIKKAVLKYNRPLKEYLIELISLIENRPISLEVLSLDKERMLKEALILSSIFKGNINIKIPINPDVESHSFEGLKVIKLLSKKQIATTCTVVMTPEQALLAAKAGAKYISPFAGRVDDYLRTKNKEKFQKTDYYPAKGKLSSYDKRILEDEGIISGIDLLTKCVEIIKGYNSEIIGASIRNSRQTREAALVGTHISTLPFNVIKQMVFHHKTSEGVKNLIADIVPEYQNLFQ